MYIIIINQDTFQLNCNILAIVTLLLINLNLVFIKKKKSLATVSADRRLRKCSLDTRTPTDKNIQCNDQSTCMGQHCISKKDNSKFPVFFGVFLPTIRIKKNYSNIDGIEEYSNSRLFVDIPSSNVCFITTISLQLSVLFMY
jgi:hypothetical protein